MNGHRLEFPVIEFHCLTIAWLPDGKVSMPCSAQAIAIPTVGEAFCENLPYQRKRVLIHRQLSDINSAHLCVFIIPRSSMFR